MSKQVYIFEVVRTESRSKEITVTTDKGLDAAKKTAYTMAGNMAFQDAKECGDPEYSLDLLSVRPEAELSREWWRHISCHKCGQCESMPGDEQRWHSQTFEFVHAFEGSEDESLHGHGVYRCPECKDLVVCELVEEFMDEDGVLDIEVTRRCEDARFLNSYKCPYCGHNWHNAWSCTCNDVCPKCRLSDIEPHSSQDIEP